MPRSAFVAAGVSTRCAGLVLLGALVAAAPQSTVTVASTGALLLLWLSIRQSVLAWDMFAFVLGGAMVLGYGFVNIGVLPGLPLPLIDAVVISMGVYAILTTHFRGPIRTPLFFWVLYLVVATSRLVIDYRTWGMDAVRDYTIAVELIALPLGYWLMCRFGLRLWIKTIGIISIVSLVYALLFPFRDVLMSIGPTVGLQQPVPLLGSYSGAGVAAGFFACMLLRPFGKRSVVVAVLFLPAIAVEQSRGMIIAVPLATLVIFFASGRLAGRLRRTTMIVVVMGFVSLALTFAASPEGRLGPTNAKQITAELETLNGGSGPGRGTFNHRKQWLSSVLTRVDEHPFGWAIGLGLGPDLTNGFQTTAVLVRKPHDDYLEAYARLGMLGLVPFVLLLVSAILPVFRAARHRSGAVGDFLWWVVGVSIVYSLIAATQPLFAYAFGTVPLFAALGAALALVGGFGADDADA